MHPTITAKEARLIQKAKKLLKGTTQLLQYQYDCMDKKYFINIWKLLYFEGEKLGNV